MPKYSLEKKADRYLRLLCQEIPDRCVGSPGNRQATAFLADTLRSFGFAITTPKFDCFSWQDQGSSLSVNGKKFPIHTSPYSLTGSCKAPLLPLATLAELRTADACGKIALLHGEIAAEQLMPKNFRFYNPEQHQEINRLLETKGFLAVLAATGKNPELAGGMYPFPLIEDGDFLLPSAYMKDTDGEKLSSLAGQVVELDIHAERVPAYGCNVIARTEATKQKIVFSAHLDAKQGTPGALDNATGIITLLLLAELFQDYSGPHQIELLAFNGEDYYSSPGENMYLDMELPHFSDIMLNINIDGVGYHAAQTAFSFYACPDGLKQKITEQLTKSPDLVPGFDWYQGDHMVFMQNNVPALAVTSNAFHALWSEIAHTDRDTPELVDCQKLVQLAQALSDLCTNQKIA